VKQILRWPLWLLEAIPFFLMMGIFRLIGLDAASALGGWLARTIAPLSPTQGLAKRNLAQAMPELTPDQIAVIVRGMWDNLGRTFAEYPHLHRFIGFPNDRVEVVGLQNAKDAASGNGVILVSGHFANWEVLALTVYRVGLEGTSLYRPTNNRIVNAWIMWQRQRCGYPRQISKNGDGARDMLRILKANTYVALLVDQKHREGQAIPYFGRDAMTATGPAILSLRTGAAIVPVTIERTKGARFRVAFLPKMEFTRSGDKAADTRLILSAINAFMEGAVRANPSMWLWAHDRWLEGG
jgi:KDO2-lipid IV(A) lauroyltransferase